MKKTLSVLLATLMMLMLLAPLTGVFAEGEIVDGKFVKTRQITVEVFDRGLDGGRSTPENNYFTNWIKEGVLRDLNIEITFKPVPRWTEVEQLNNLLAAGDAPDICYTYNYPTVQTYANMGGVLDMRAYLDDNKDLLPNLWSWLGEKYLNWYKNPETSVTWAITARLAHYTRINTFVREDWLKKLNLAEPTTLAEFEAMLKAFQDNAALLLGDQADKMIPFSTSFDVSWRGEHLMTSFVPSDITDKELYTHDFDDRRILYPGYKEGVRKLNEWYNAGLIWKDFALYPAGDTTEDNLIKAGYVGSFMHNWDYPYRNAEDGIHFNLKRQVGEDAVFIAIEPFENDAGEHKKFLGAGNDRNVFFPATNDEPVASLMYLDWTTKLENRVFLQTGQEGVNHEVLADGTIKMLSAQGEYIMNSPSNIDYTMTINGLDLGDTDKNTKALALNYAGVDARFIEKAYKAAINDGLIGIHFNCGTIASEEGMGPALKEKRDVLMATSVVAAPDKFDAVYDSAFTDFLASGAQAIIDERTVAFEKYYEQ